MISRRETLVGLGGLSAMVAGGIALAAPREKLRIDAGINSKISLSQWSFHREIFGNSRDDYNRFLSQLQNSPDDVLQGPLDARDITKRAQALNVHTIDLVNLFFFGRAKDKAWLRDFKKRADGTGTQLQLIMCDEAGKIGATSKVQRQTAIELHMQWLDAAAILGCKQIRVNAYGDGTYLQQLDQCAESLSVLSSAGEKLGIELLVENHGHPASNGAWLAMLMQHTSHKNLGVLTDLDNFFMGGWSIDPERRYDRVQGLTDLAPYTRGVSVKSYDFDKKGNETKINYEDCFRIIQKAGFNGFYSAEYEGSRMSELDGTKATINLTHRALTALENNKQK